MKRNFKCFFIILMLHFSLLPSLLAGGSEEKLRKGIDAYKAESWDEALNHFQDALVDAPENPQLHYNVGTALYKKERYEDAVTSFEKALKTENPQLQQAVYYNQGNTFYRLDKYQEAVEAYKKAIDLDPEDVNAKHNLELVRAKLKEMADKQQQEQDQNQDQKKIEPSEYAKQLKVQAEILVSQRLYKEAHDLMMQGMQADETVAAFQDFIGRIKDVLTIEGGS